MSLLTQLTIWYSQDIEMWEYYFRWLVDNNRADECPKAFDLACKNTKIDY